MSKAKTLIDELTEDLLTNANLDPVPVTVMKYRIPRALLPQNCPALIVRRGDKSVIGARNKLFTYNLEIVIEYHVAAIEEAQTLVLDDAVSIELLDQAERIEARIRELAYGGVNNTVSYELTPARSSPLDPRLMQGLTEGYALSVLARVDER